METNNVVIELERQIAVLKDRNQTLEYAVARLDKIRVTQARVLEAAKDGMRCAVEVLAPDPLPHRIEAARDIVETYFAVEDYHEFCQGR